MTALDGWYHRVGVLHQRRWGTTPHLTKATLEKLDEEVAELAEAAHLQHPDHVVDELGDVLFVVAALANHLGVRSLWPAMESAYAKNAERWQQ